MPAVGQLKKQAIVTLAPAIQCRLFGIGAGRAVGTIPLPSRTNSSSPVTRRDREAPCSPQAG
jgi:hypothetical protein